MKAIFNICFHYDSVQIAKTPKNKREIEIKKKR